MKQIVCHTIACHPNLGTMQENSFEFVGQPFDHDSDLAFGQGVIEPFLHDVFYSETYLLEENDVDIESITQCILGKHPTN